MAHKPHPKLLHLSGGGKGGTGKTFFARSLTQYFLDHDLEFVAVEADRSNPDLARVYRSIIDVKFAVLSEGTAYENDANILYNLALQGRVICNLPAQVFPSLKAWVTNLDLLALAEEEGVIFKHWFVTNGGHESLSLLRRYTSTFDPSPAWSSVVVLNHGTAVGGDFSGFFEDTELQAMLTEFAIPTIHLPAFQGASTRNRLDREGIPLGQAFTHKRFTSIEQQRVRKYLRETYAAIQQVGGL